MLATFLEEIEVEVNLRMPDLIRAVLDHKEAAHLPMGAGCAAYAAEHQCVHMMLLGWLQRTFVEIEDWLDNKASYCLPDDELCDIDQRKFNDWCREIFNTQSCARVDELACGKCHLCRIQYYSEALLDIEPEMLRSNSFWQLKIRYQEYQEAIQDES